MANQYNAATLAANAQHLEGLAKTARSTMLSRTTEKATRLGSEGEKLRRQAKAAEDQRAAAENVAEAQVHEAAAYDAEANRLELRATAAANRHDPRGAREATELREEAAKQREGAEVARAKSRLSTKDAERLGEEAAQLRSREQAIDAEIADLGTRLPVTEQAIDRLEWHAEKARDMATTVRRADEAQTQAAAATARGDHAAAAQLNQRAAGLRDDADVLAAVRGHPPFPVDHAVLKDLGVEVSPADLSVPLPELMDPNPLMTDPLADASTSGSAERVAATDVTDADAATNADAAELSFDSVGSTEPLTDSSADSSFDDPVVESPAFNSPEFEAPLFAESAATDTSFVESSFAARLPTPRSLTRRLITPSTGIRGSSIRG